MQVRCLISAANASNAFDLRCLVREKMIAYLRDHHPKALPCTRLLAKMKKGKKKPVMESSYAELKEEE